MKEEKKELKEHKKVKLSNKNILLIVIGIVLVSLAGTFAWFTWRSNDTALVLTVGDISSAQVTLKPYKLNAELAPVTSYEDQVYTNVTAVNNSTTAKKINLYYHINKIDSELISTSFKYTITKSTDNGSTYTEYKTGNFSTAANNIDLYIMDETVDGNNNIKYKVYIWLDGTGPNEGVAGKSFSGELRAKIEDIEAPHYMNIPVNFASTYGDNLNSITFMGNTNYPSCLTAEDIEAIESNIDSYNIAEYATNTPDGYTGKIMHYPCYVELEDGSRVLDIYIGSTEGKVYAPEDSTGLFANLGGLTAINGMEYFNTSNTTNMSSMFKGATSLKNLDLSHFNTSNVTDMSEMFSFYGDAGDGKMTTINLSSFDTSNVTNMWGMFNNWCSLTSIDLSSFDTSNVTDMSYMFSTEDCMQGHNTERSGDLTSINFGTFNTSSVTAMSAIFYGQKKLQGSFTIATSAELEFADYMFYYTAANASSNFVVNYNSVNASAIDEYINQKTSDAKVVKGSCIDC